MLYKQSLKNKPFEDNPELLTLPKFAVLNDREMLYVMFFTDRKSPFRHLEENKRKRASAMRAGWGTEKSNRDRSDVLEKLGRDAIEKVEVKEAIEYYKTLDYDPADEDVEIIGLQIESIKKMVRDAATMGKTNALDPAEMKKINDLLMSLPDLRKTQRDILKTAGIELPNSEELQPTKELSTIDKMNMELQAQGEDE